MGAQYIVRITASSEDGHYVEVKLDGLAAAPTDVELETAKQSAAELFECAFGDQPDEILVKDSMRYVSDEADDRDGLAAERGQRPHTDNEGYEVQ